jgi:hypothetical protein
LVVAGTCPGKYVIDIDVHRSNSVWIAVGVVALTHQNLQNRLDKIHGGLCLAKRPRRIGTHGSEGAKR